MQLNVDAKKQEQFYKERTNASRADFFRRKREVETGDFDELDAEQGTTCRGERLEQFPLFLLTCIALKNRSVRLAEPSADEPAERTRRPRSRGGYR